MGFWTEGLSQLADLNLS